MASRARKVSRAFEKRTPGSIPEELKILSSGIESRVKRGRMGNHSAEFIFRKFSM